MSSESLDVAALRLESLGLVFQLNMASVSVNCAGVPSCEDECGWAKTWQGPESSVFKQISQDTIPTVRFQCLLPWHFAECAAVLKWRHRAYHQFNLIQCVLSAESAVVMSANSILAGYEHGSGWKSGQAQQEMASKAVGSESDDCLHWSELIPCILMASKLMSNGMTSEQMMIAGDGSPGR